MSLEVLKDKVEDFESLWLKSHVKSILNNSTDEIAVCKEALQLIEKWKIAVQLLRIFLSIISFSIIPLIYKRVTKKPWLAFKNIDQGKAELKSRISEGFKSLSDEKITEKEITPRKWKDVASLSDAEQETQPHGSIGTHQIMVTEELGKGGFGKVHKAIYRYGDSAEQNVAVKTVHKENARGTHLRALKNEATQLVELEHANVVSMLAAGYLKGGKYAIILELSDIGSLGDLVKTEMYENMTWGERGSIAADFATGVAYMHGKNLIHRDLKSGNVLIFRDESKAAGYTAKLCDFGAVVTVEEAKKRRPFGTFNWYAPEVLYGKIYEIKGTQTKASDVWSLGLLLLLMATRQQPFDEFTIISLLLDHLQKGKRETMDKTTPDAYKILVQRCWKYEPGLRPSAEEVRNNLACIVFN